MSPDLRRYRGKHRLLLVFSPVSSDEYGEQERLLEGHETGFEERDLSLVRLPEGGPGVAGGEPLPPEEAAAARREYGVQSGRFVVVLVGKDGGEKLRSDRPVAPGELFERIDAMPMRRREMRESGEAGRAAGR